MADLATLKQQFHDRASHPPANTTGQAWRDYEKEMRDLESQLRDAGEDF